MSRENLLRMLEAHRAFDPGEDEMRREIIHFVRLHEGCFERELEIGHITGSAWVLDLRREAALLTHHAKLDRWLQLGGHADGDSDVLRVALREAREESGLEEVRPVAGEIFDVDAHQIPARGSVPAHVHYDIRFLFEADREAPLRMTSESKGLAWVGLTRIHELNTDASVMRMVAKSLARFR
jgi:8-oxo-dGTP pyrophosphatase MutT (NUDIX family)